MSGSVNKVILVGRLGRDPEVRTFQNGNKVVNLRIATSETWKDKSTGERKEKTEWHSVAIFNEGIARVAEQYLRKGSNVYIEGQLETRKWQDQSGADRYTTEVVVKQFRGEMTLLDGKSDSRDDDEPRQQQRERREEPRQQGRGDDFDDSIPFACEWRI